MSVEKEFRYSLNKESEGQYSKSFFSLVGNSLSTDVTDIEKAAKMIRGGSRLPPRSRSRLQASSVERPSPFEIEEMHATPLLDLGGIAAFTL
ncbi:hypothetical protein Q3G72_030226 [Acer saccharum]|nr:hypothetical protein Q3G72_030226 [Acer saccharum]